MFDTCSFKPTNDGFPPSSGGGGGAVTSVFGRTGAVIAVAGDYNSSQITNSSGVTGAFVTDALNTLNSGKLSTSLTSAQIIVGNASNVATAVAMSGDATISNTGVLTLKNTGTAGTYGSATQVPVLTTDAQGRVTAVTNTAITGFVPTSLTSAQIIVGNASDVATAVAMSGDATISNTGVLTLKNTGTAGTYGSATQVPVLTTDAQGRVIAITNTSITGFVPTTLTSANIIVGNASNVATAVAMSGDATISNTGAVTLANSGVVASTYGSATQVPVFAVDSKGRVTSVTNTAITAASPYTYSAITLSANTSYNKAALGGANYLFISTNSPVTRTITIDSTGFVANDFLVLSFNAASPGSITLIIGTTARTFVGNRANTIFAVYDGSEWSLQSMSNSYNTSSATNNSLALGFASNVSSTNSISLGNSSSSNAESVAIGVNAISSNSNSISIGYNSSSNTNSVTIGAGSTSSNTGVVAIGQGITLTNTDAIIIGRGAGVATGTQSIAIGPAVTAGDLSIVIGTGSTGTGNIVKIGHSASANLTDSVVIGNSATGQGGSVVVIGASSIVQGANTVAIGRSINTSTNTGVVAIGQGITSTNTDNVIIGRAASAAGATSIAIGQGATAGGTNNITIGIGSTGTGSGCIRIGSSITTSSFTDVIAIGRNISPAGLSCIIIGNSGTAGGETISIGDGITSFTSSSVAIGFVARTTKSRQFAKGTYAYPRHYGAESRRIDTNQNNADSLNPSRHDEKDAWNGTTTNNATTELFLFGVSNERLTLQDNEILTATVQVQAKRNATTDCFVDTAFVSIIRGVGAGTVTLVLAPSSVNTGFLGTGATVTYTLDADTTNGSLRFRATGNTGETWQWTANIITYTRTRTA